MGRKKMIIATKPEKHRLTTYNKRKPGISKKASELAILCDTDVLLLTVSPKGKQDLTLGPNSNFENVIRRYGKVDPHERERRRVEGVEILQKAYKEDKDHQVDTEELLKHGAPKTDHTYEMSPEEMQLIERKLGKLKYMKEIHVIQDTGLLNDMELELHKLLEQTDALIKNLQVPEPREINYQAVPLQHYKEEINSPTLPNFYEEEMPYDLQISRDTTDPSDNTSSMLALMMKEDPDVYLNLNSYDDEMKGSQEYDWKRPDA